ncbi:hypothetical protein D9M71_137390 [compost metagenome]
MLATRLLAFKKAPLDGWAWKWKKPDSMAGFLKASRCVLSNSRCYKNKPIPRGKVFYAEKINRI